MTASNSPERITFEYVRSPFFRVVHSNGAWGGITPRQELAVTFYSERRSIPRHVTHEFTSDGRLGPEISREDAQNIQRECEVEVLMSMAEAVNLYRWLGTKIEEWRQIASSVPKDNPLEA